MGKADRFLQDASGSTARRGTPAAMPGAGRIAPPPIDARDVGVVRSKDALSIRLDRIVRDPDQPREDFDADELDRLAASIRSHGLLQPIRVRWDEGQGAYVVLTGERRWRAARMAGLSEIPCVVHAGALDAGARLGIQLVENALRHDLRPVEQARAYRTLMDARGWTAADLARELSIHKATVGRALALLDLPAAVQERVEQGGLGASAGAEIAKLDRPEDQAAVAAAVEQGGLNHKDVAEIVRAVQARKAPTTRAARPAPFAHETADAVVSIRWKRATATTAAAVLAAALEHARAGGAEAGAA